jgi:hypothetical protein
LISNSVEFILPPLLLINYRRSHSLLELTIEGEEERLDQERKEGGREGGEGTSS